LLGPSSARSLAAAPARATLLHPLEFEILAAEVQNENLRRTVAIGFECTFVARRRRIEILGTLGKKLLLRFVVFLNEQATIFYAYGENYVLRQCVPPGKPAQLAGREGDGFALFKFGQRRQQVVFGIALPIEWK
jgi:hypothetical protein